MAPGERARRRPGVLGTYQRCEKVLAEVGAEPTATTRQLIDQPRR
jgi:hypothetical protein